MESGWNVRVWLVGVVSRRWVWLVEWVEYMGVVSRIWVWVKSMGVVSGCGCKEVYRFTHYLSLLLLYLLIFAASLLFVHYLNVFS